LKDQIKIYSNNIISMEAIIQEKDNKISVLKEENEKLGSEIIIQNQN